MSRHVQKIVEEEAHEKRVKSRAGRPRNNENLCVPVTIRVEPSTLATLYAAKITVTEALKEVATRIRSGLAQTEKV